MTNIFCSENKWKVMMKFFEWNLFCVRFVSSSYFFLINIRKHHRSVVDSEKKHQKKDHVFFQSQRQKNTYTNLDTLAEYDISADLERLGSIFVIKVACPLTHRQRLCAGAGRRGDRSRGAVMCLVWVSGAIVVFLVRGWYFAGSGTVALKGTKIIQM